MKYFSTALYALFLVMPLAGCGGGTEEEAPPTSAPEMSAEQKANYEKQMQMMMDARTGGKK